MAIQWGATSGGFRLGIDQVGSTLIVYAGSVGYGHNWSGTLSRSGAWSGSTSFSFYSPTSGTVQKEIYRAAVSASGTYTVSTSYWNGSASCSRKVTVGSAPGAPAITSVTHGNPYVFNFTKGSGSTSTTVQWSQNGAAYYTGASTTGTSISSSLTADSYWRARLYGTNSAGNSKYSNTAIVYTTPKTPGTPKLAADSKVSWTLPASYKHGVQLAYRDTSSGAGTVVELGAVTSWTDPQTQPPSRQYRVRSWAGPSQDQARTYSAWSAWSDTAMGVTYKPPAVTLLTVERCTSTGVVSQMGTYLRLTTTGTVSSVKDGSTELNSITRRVRWRPTGGSWTTWTVLVNKAAPAAWSKAASTLAYGTIDVTKSYEVEFEVIDEYQTVTVSRTVPVASVAASYTKTGMGVGKIGERGALDVGGDLHVEGDLHLADPNIIVITGVGYERSGSMTVTVDITTAFGSMFYGTATIAMPYAPPAGWGFLITKAGGTPMAFVDQETVGTSQTQTCSLYRPSARAGNTVPLAWQLVRVG